MGVSATPTPASRAKKKSRAHGPAPSSVAVGVSSLALTAVAGQLVDDAEREIAVAANLGEALAPGEAARLACSVVRGSSEAEALTVEALGAGLVEVGVAVAAARARRVARAVAERAADVAVEVHGADVVVGRADAGVEVAGVR